MLIHFNNHTPLGIEPSYESRKTPADVYNKLVLTNKSIHKIIKKLGGDCLKLGPKETQRNNIKPADVYDLASLVIAELHYLRNLIGTSLIPKSPYYPGKKFPSHVYQRVSQLESQVHMIFQELDQ